jgi:arylsulfatase A-like enzyme
MKRFPAEVRNGILLTMFGVMLASGTGFAVPHKEATLQKLPDILLITVDTLRHDRMSIYGYQRETSPNLDRLMSHGTVFNEARTVEPLTAPALTSMLTSISPHLHGSTRNGLKMRPGLDSLPLELAKAGYETAAFVGNWTMKHKLTRMGDHFDTYDVILNRKRWFGLLKGEATAEDLNQHLLTWLEDNKIDRDKPRKPLFLWIHYVEPHAPYRYWPEDAAALGLNTDKPGKLTKSDRYDTEIHFVDRRIGELLTALDEGKYLRDAMTVFTSDHGESLGEHNYWGHGRHLYESNLHIPMSITWPGHVPRTRINALALNTDLAPTILHLIGQVPHQRFEGFDWAGVLQGTEQLPAARVTMYQAHKGAVVSNVGSEMARRSGLLEVGTITGSSKELFRIETNRRSLFNLVEDPREGKDLSTTGDDPTGQLLGWMRVVYEQLVAFDDLPPEPLDEESVLQLKSLGYVD